MNPYLLNTLEFGPTIMRRLLRFVPESRWDEEKDGRFSVREAIAHLADWESILLERMKLTVNQDGATLQGRDETERALEMRYRETNPWEQADLFAQRRHQTVEWLRARSDEDWRRGAMHSERGLQTLYDQANMLLGHDMYHLEHLTTFLESKTAGTW